MEEISFILQEELDSWKEEHGSPYTTKITGRNIKIILLEVRREKLEILFRILKGYGVTRDFFTGPNREKIIRACIPEKKSIGKKKYNELSAYVGVDIDYIKTKIFGKASDDFKSGKTDIVMDFKSKEELEGEKSAEEAANDSVPIDTKSKRKSEPKPVSKEFDPSTISDTSEPSDMIDPNLEEWLREK